MEIDLIKIIATVNAILGLLLVFMREAVAPYIMPLATVLGILLIADSVILIVAYKGQSKILRRIEEALYERAEMPSFKRRLE